MSQDKHKLEKEVDALRQELAEIKEMNSRILQMAETGIINVTAMSPQAVKPVASL